MGCTSQLLELLCIDSVSHRKPREKWQEHLVVTFSSARLSELCAPTSIERKIHLHHCNTLTCAAPEQSALYNSHQNIMYPKAYFSSNTNASNILMIQSLHPLASQWLSCRDQLSNEEEMAAFEPNNW